MRSTARSISSQRNKTRSGLCTVSFPVTQSERQETFPRLSGNKKTTPQFSHNVVRESASKIRHAFPAPVDRAKIPRPAAASAPKRCPSVCGRRSFWPRMPPTRAPDPSGGGRSSSSGPATVSISVLNVSFTFSPVFALVSKNATGTRGPQPCRWPQSCRCGLDCPRKKNAGLSLSLSLSLACENKKKSSASGPFRGGVRGPGQYV